MGLFSFRKSDTDDTPRGRPSAEFDDADGLGAGQYQRQRARRRLIGAVVLVLCAITLLPLVFDGRPKPTNEELAVLMPGDVQPAKGAVKAATPQSAEAAAPNPSLDSNETLVDPAAVPTQVPAGAALRDKPAQDKPIQDKPVPNKPAQGKASDPEAAKKPAGKSKHIVQIGAFRAESNARSWLQKFKQQKLPVFIEHAQTDAGERWMLRAGPFADREHADAAVKQIERAGLSGRVVEQ